MHANSPGFRCGIACAMAFRSFNRVTRAGPRSLPRSASSRSWARIVRHVRPSMTGPATSKQADVGFLPVLAWNASTTGRNKIASSVGPLSACSSLDRPKRRSSKFRRVSASLLDSADIYLLVRRLGTASIPSKCPLALKRNHELILIRDYSFSYLLSFFWIEICRCKPHPAYTHFFELLINFSLHPI